MFSEYLLLLCARGQTVATDFWHKIARTSDVAVPNIICEIAELRNAKFLGNDLLF